MQATRHRAFATLVSTTSTLSLTMIFAQAALAAPTVVPMPGEDFLTPAERAAAVAEMTPQERGAVGQLLSDDAPGLVVAYARREFTVLEGPDGTRTVEPVGIVSESPAGSLSVPVHQVAATTSLTKSGTKLFISLTLVKTRSTSPYEWQVYEWAQWGSNGSYSPAGMDCCNNDQDSFGIAWAGNLALYSDIKSGTYQSWCSGEPALNIYRSDIINNVGVGHSFNEWWDPDNCPMYYAQADNRIRETTWKSQTSNVSMKYFHTWGSYDYSLSFSAVGPSVTVSPTTASWSANIYLSFAH
jgi:hypothetical protein